MNSNETIKLLKSTIDSKLSPLIDADYVYWDLPYHINIGDTLIWQGTLDFLADKPYKMLDFGSSSTASLEELSEKTVILLHGGGNFGDIYASSQDFRKHVVKTYEKNKIIILPQTIYFEDKEKEKNDFQIFSKHENLYLCVRDHESYELALKYLNKEKVLLLPDMAFCIKEESLKKGVSTGKKLLMKRVDLEAIEVNDKYLKEVDKQSDWPTFEKHSLKSLYLRLLLRMNRKEFNAGYGKKTQLSKYIDDYAMNYFRKYLLKTGIGFINSYDVVYTTRLHGCILSLLLNKEIILLDNSYGKNKAYYNVWLKGCENIKVEKSC